MIRGNQAESSYVQKSGEGDRIYTTQQRPPRLRTVRNAAQHALKGPTELGQDVIYGAQGFSSLHRAGSSYQAARQQWVTPR